MCTAHSCPASLLPKREKAQAWNWVCATRARSPRCFTVSDSATVLAVATSGLLFAPHGIFLIKPLSWEDPLSLRLRSC